MADHGHGRREKKARELAGWGDVIGWVNVVCVPGAQRWNSDAGQRRMISIMTGNALKCVKCLLHRLRGFEGLGWCLIYLDYPVFPHHIQNDENDENEGWHVMSIGQPALAAPMQASRFRLSASPPTHPWAIARRGRCRF